MTLAAQSTKDSKYIHDTAKLMQNYRDVLWNAEVSEQNLQAEFRAEYGAANGIQITDLDISNPRLAGDAQSIARSKKMLQLIDSSANLIRERHKKGEFYYLILYYSYLSPQRFKNTNEILHALEQKGISLSLRIYYGRRKKALEILSSVLWGYTSIACNDILTLFDHLIK